MMKKRMGLCLLLLFLAVLPAAAENDFAIDERYTFTGMDRSYMRGYEPTVQNSVMTLCAPIVSRAEGKITATLRMTDETASPLRANEYTASFTKNADGVYRVKLELTLSRARKNGDYPAMLILSGVDASGGALRGEIPYLLRIRNGAANDDAGTLDLTDIAAELRVGEDGSLTATIKNAGKTKQMREIALSVSDASGDILPLGVMPLSLGTLNPKEERAISIPLSVRGNASVSLHTLNFTMNFKALEQNQEVKLSYTLPVKQDMRLEQGGVQMPATIIQGDLSSLTLPLMNMGKGEIRNALASLDLPGVAQGQSVLVGTIAAGETKQAKMSFSAGKQMLGEAVGELTVSYEDAFGNADSFALPVSLTVEEPPVVRAASAGGTAEADKQETPLVTYLLGGGCGALLIALILQGVILRNKIHKMEEDRL